MELVAGAVIGGGIGFGLWRLRDQHWQALSSFGNALIAFILALLVLGFIFLVGSGRGGSEAITAAMTGLVLLIAGGLGAFGLSALIGGTQARSLGRSWLRVSRTAIVDVLALGLALLLYHSLVFQPSQRAISNEWWAKEQARRSQVETPRSKIPPDFQGWNTAMLEQHKLEREELAKQGIDMPSMVPPEVERAIRESEAAASMPLAADLTAYERTQRNMRNFASTLSASWAVFALAIPLFTRRPETTPPPKVEGDVKP